MHDRRIQTVQQETIPFSDSDFKIRIHINSTASLTASRMFHPEIEIKYFYDGEAWLLVDEDNIHAKPGDIVIANPYEIHSTISVGKEPAKYHIMIINLDFFSEDRGIEFDLSHLLLVKRIQFNHLIRNNPTLQALFLQIIAEAEHSKTYYRSTIRGLLQAFFALLLRDEINAQANVPGGGEAEKYYSVIEPALQKIRTDYRNTLPLDTLAKLCSISKSHFCRIFKLVTGQTVVHYIINYRLKIAKLMLENSDYSISQVAEQCGFLDEGYFCRCYKRKYHKTPKQDCTKDKRKQKITL